MKRRIWIAIASLGLLTAFGCRQAPPAPEERYEIAGTVVSVEPDESRVTIDHQAVPGLMGAMTMPFHLKDRWAFRELAPGDHVSATLVVSGDRSWLEGIVISRGTDIPDTVSGVPDPEPGAEVPGFELVNQDGEAIRLESYRGKALVLTFIYTRCPLTEFCPRMTHHFVEIEKALRENPSLYEKTHLLTISFDPEHDTPAALRRYAREQGAANQESFRHWEFATGSGEEVRKLASFFALEYSQDGDQIAHTLRTAVIGPDGKLWSLYRGNAWKPEDVLNDIARMEL